MCIPHLEGTARIELQLIRGHSQVSKEAIAWNISEGTDLGLCAVPLDNYFNSFRVHCKLKAT